MSAAESGGPSWPPPARGAVAGPRYASWERRTAAFLVDLAPSLLASVVFAAGYLMALVSLARQAISGASDLVLTAGAIPMAAGLGAGLVALGWQAYNRWHRAGHTGRSLGKQLLGLTLLGEDTGRPIGFAGAFLRDVVHLLDGLTVVGYLWPLWDDRRQTLADKIVRTIVAHEQSWAAPAASR